MKNITSSLLVLLLIGCASQEYVPKQDFVGENLGHSLQYPGLPKDGIPKLPPVPVAPKRSSMRLLALDTFVIPNTNVYAVTLVWNRVNETNVAGYKVYHGTAPRAYTFITDAGNRTNQAVSNLVVGTTYYFAATAYNTVNVESAFSDEVSLILFPPPPPPKIGFVTNIVQWAPDVSGPWAEYTNYVFRAYSNGVYRVFLKTD